MQNKYSYSLVWKIISWLMLVFFTYPIIGTSTGQIEYNKPLLFVYSALIILSIISIYVFSTSFFIDYQQVGIKYLFRKQKNITRHDINGYYIKPGQYFNEVVFTDNISKKKICIPASGKRLINALNNFITNINEMILEKTYNEILKKGLIITRYTKKGIYFIDNSGITILKSHEKIGWESVKAINITGNGSLIFYEIIANKRIKFNQLNTNGCVGILKYLNEKASELKIV